MALKTITSKIAPVIIGTGRMKSTTYISTKVTGPDNTGSFNSEIIQSDNASGGGSKTIWARDSNGNITWGNDASGKIKLNESKFRKASNNQISSLANQLATTAVEKQALNAASGRGNQDNTDGNADGSQSKAAPKPTDKSGGLSGSGEGNDNPRTSYERGLCYPTTMRRSLQDNIKIDIIKFNPKVISGGASQARFADTTDAEGITTTGAQKKKGATIGTVILPIPGSVQDGNKTDWGSGTMTPVDMAKANVVKSLLGKEGGSAAGQEINTIVNQTQNDQMMDEGLKSFFTEQLTGTTDLLSRTAGAVLNPNMELLFKGPSLRAFSFSWKMSPRDQKESIVIAKIIRTFKQSMAPQKTKSGLFLKAPNIYQLTFQKGTDTHKFLPKMKECALNDCSVNYTPDGGYMTYDNSAMVAVEMTLSFQEMEPIYNNDMSHEYDSIGY